jgi:hypothetical protein
MDEKITKLDAKLDAVKLNSDKVPRIEGEIKTFIANVQSQYETLRSEVWKDVMNGIIGVVALIILAAGVIMVIIQFSVRFTLDHYIQTEMTPIIYKALNQSYYSIPAEKDTELRPIAPQHVSDLPTIKASATIKTESQVEHMVKKPKSSLLSLILRRKT